MLLLVEDGGAGGRNRCYADNHFGRNVGDGVAVRIRQKSQRISRNARLPGISLPGDRTVHLQCAGNVEIREYSRVEVQLRLQGARKSMQSTYSPSGMGMEVKWHRLSKLVE